MGAARGLCASPPAPGEGPVKALGEPIYLVGLPGSGKSKVGKLLAQVLRVPHIDTDRCIEKLQGATIPDLFTRVGEAGFRKMEAEVVLATSGPAVVSLGGGVVETPAVREFLKSQTVVWIDAEDPVLVQRVGGGKVRPLLADDPAGSLRELRARRTPYFEGIANLKVTSSHAPAAGVAGRILRGLANWEVTWVPGSHRYPVITGPGTSALLARYLPAGATKAFVVFPGSLSPQATSLRQELEGAGLETHLFAHVDGEDAKDLKTAAAGWDALGSARVGRGDLVITLGGGVTTDLGGFLAATWLRGIPVIHVPTSLLAMVDAAIGGKTGIDTGAGKNLVGAFYDPIAVLADLDYLTTLPPEEYVAGLAEVVKAGFIADPAILSALSADPQVARSPEARVLAEVVGRAVAVKAKVVGGDRLERGQREILNYGHTLGHAIEKVENYRVRHGEAVAIGMVFAAALAERLGLSPPGTAQAHRQVLGRVGLPTHYEGDVEALLEAMTADKKVRGGALRFVLLQDGAPTVVAVEEASLRDLFEELGMSA